MKLLFMSMRFLLLAGLLFGMHAASHGATCAEDRGTTVTAGEYALFLNAVKERGSGSHSAMGDAGEVSDGSYGSRNDSHSCSGAW